METLSRPAVRVVCFDADGRVLMLRWRDPHDAHLLWEPPGGGIDPGETPLAAARRELAEETGLDPAAIDARFRLVHRDAVWKGNRWVGEEQFFPAYFRTSRPILDRAGLLGYEQSALIGHEWVAPADLASLPDRLEPPELAAVIESLRATVIIVGDTGGVTSWQSTLEAAEPAATRIRPSSWSGPVLDDWVAALDTAVNAAAPGVVLAAHGAGTQAVAQWAAHGSGRDRVAGALLVPGRSVPVPAQPLPFRSIVAPGTDDPGGANAAAAAWGSRFVDAGPPALGAWPQARTLIGELRA
jgi:predicted alpha/beta hydrolase family esterase/8-oxo-dGTP pyrophosphatase MutT (NUDIX family)